MNLTELPPLNEALLRRFDVPGPRYTSYPTADRFVEAFGPEQYRQAARPRLVGSMPLALYVHIPFCESVCYYCACNKVVTRQHERAVPYLAALDREAALQAAICGSTQAVTQLHLGGGTPTFLDDLQLAALLESLKRHFRFSPDATLSIEVDPRTVDLDRLEQLARLGFSRLSFGVQDVDPLVQKAVHRVQPLAAVQDLMAAARRIGFASINLDLIYGLPRQTAASFAHTVQCVNDLRPDRIALYAYAHLPQRFKPQRRILASQLPSAGERVAMLSQAIRGFLDQGYEFIGMDHFALPKDTLAVARRQGRLQRSFQGYDDGIDGDLIGLGVSAISHVGACYSQNAKTLEEYYDALEQGELPIVRGLALTRQDLLRRAVIMALMCQGRVEFEALEQAYLIDMRREFAAELAALEPMAQDGLITFEPGAIEVTPLGRYFVRGIAMVFDRYLQSDRNRERFSRIL